MQFFNLLELVDLVSITDGIYITQNLVQILTDFLCHLCSRMYYYFILF